MGDGRTDDNCLTDAQAVLGMAGAVRLGNYCTDYHGNGMAVHGSAYDMRRGHHDYIMGGTLFS